jgi:hypothetical protein
MNTFKEEPEEKLLTKEEFDSEARKLELELKKLQVQTIRDDIDNKKLESFNRLERSRQNGVAIADQMRTDAAFQSACSHKKGGVGMEGLNGRGNSAEYAVVKIGWFTGEQLVRCLRCSKTWKPVRRAAFPEGKKGDEQFQTAHREWKEACGFHTNNQPMGTYQVRFTTPEAQERYAHMMDTLNLR